MASCHREELLRRFGMYRPPRKPKPSWSPPEDPDRPLLPYMPGFQARIESHVAPAPVGRLDSRSWPQERVSRDEMKTLTQSALVVSHPPIEATTTPSDMGAPLQIAQLTITSQISVGCGSGAQVVVCTVAKDGEPPFDAVAKIYDALYYRFNHSLAMIPRDVTAWADKDYAVEAAAYEQLNSAGLAGQATPAYYGSWTFNLPISSVGVQQMRPVRLLLIEHLQGSNPVGLRGGDAFHLPEEYRLEVLAHAMDAYVRALHCGVEHNHFVDRHILMCSENTTTGGTSTGIPRVVLLDYHTAIVSSRTLDGRRAEESSALPVNPMQWFWQQAIGADFCGWVPPEWDAVRKPMQEWLVQRFGSMEQRALYEPVSEELKFDEF